jgi:nucleoside-diphosphate-sugar epimerase
MAEKGTTKGKMRVFVTGATGFIGSAVVRELIGAGHQVLGLARSDEAAEALVAAGADVHRGSIDDLESLRGGAAASDGVIHTAFNHDFSKFKESSEADRRAITAIGDELRDSHRPFVVTSAVGLLPPGKVARESDVLNFEVNPSPRVASEQAADTLLQGGANVTVVRNAVSVHGKGDHGFIPTLIRIAREKGVSAYVDEGTNRWPAVHRLDAALLYRLALERGAAGTRYHAVAEEGVPFHDIAGAIGLGLKLPITSVPTDRAPEIFGAFAHFAAIDVPASSDQTRKLLGWQPTQPGLLADIGYADYFRDQSTR